MKTSEAKEKKFRELSDEELQKVTGGTKFTITPITPIAPGGGGENTMACFVQRCPRGYKLDRSLQPCQCVPEPNAVWR